MKLFSFTVTIFQTDNHFVREYFEVDLKKVSLVTNYFDTTDCNFR